MDGKDNKTEFFETLKQCGSDIQSLLQNREDLDGFLNMVTTFGAFPNISRRPSQESRSLIEIISKGRDVTILEKEFGAYFTSVNKPAGKSIPFMLRFSPLVKYLGGIRPEQAFFTRKCGTGEFYAALWPWRTTPENITVHFGYFSKAMSAEDYAKLKDAVGMYLPD